MRRTITTKREIKGLLYLIWLFKNNIFNSADFESDHFNTILAINNVKTDKESTLRRIIGFRKKPGNRTIEEINDLLVWPYNELSKDMKYDNFDDYLEKKKTEIKKHFKIKKHKNDLDLFLKENQKFQYEKGKYNFSKPLLQKHFTSHGSSPSKSVHALSNNEVDNLTIIDQISISINQINSVEAVNKIKDIINQLIEGNIDFSMEIKRGNGRGIITSESSIIWTFSTDISNIIEDLTAKIIHQIESSDLNTGKGIKHKLSDGNATILENNTGTTILIKKN